MAAVDLLFTRPPVPSPGPVALVFGDEGGVVAPPGAITVNAAGQVSGLRGQVGLLRGVQALGAGRVTGLRGSARVLTVPVVRVAGTLTGLLGMVQVVQGTLAPVHGQLSGLRGHVELVQGVRVAVAGRLSGLHGQLIANYNINVQRPTVGSTGARWQDAQPQQAGVRSAYQQTELLNTGVRSHWQDAARIAVQQREHWRDTARLPRATAIYFEQALRLPVAPTRSAFQEARRLHHAANTAFKQALRLPVLPSRQRFQEAYRDRRSAIGAHFQNAAPLQRAVASGMGIAAPLQRRWGGRYQQAWPPRPGIWTPPVTPPGPGPCYVPALPARLVFAEPFDASLPARLIFKCDDKPPGPQPVTTVVVPIRRIYMTLNDITLTRADTGEPIPTYTFGMSIDVDSWTWQWSASLHHAALPLIVPGSSGDPVEVLASINGTPYRLAVETYSRQRSFGQSRIAVSGRGRAAILDAPYAPTLNHASVAARTARQLMEDALTVNGVGIGWDIDWRLTDWLVPGSTWAHQGSYISAILDIASAAGGYVQPHNTAPTLRILPRYPAAPWHWDTLTPDFELPSAVVSVEGIEWQRKAPYDRIYVSGTTGDGVLGQVTRAGRAGSTVAPMVTHPLITHADAARQRGMAELGDTGRQAHINLKLPVLQETGVIQPGALVRYVDGGDTHLGIVRSTSVDWSRPTLRQTLSVETHPA